MFDVPADTLSVQFLASGSSGNATLVRDDDAAILVDFGLAPERLVQVLREAGASVDYYREKGGSPAGEFPIRAALLTHLHGDHFHKSALRLLLDNRIPMWVNRGHLPALARHDAFDRMQTAGLVRIYSSDDFAVSQRITVKPVPLPHDSPSTHGFIFTMKTGSGRVRAAFLSDMGVCPPAVIEAAADSDLLAIEFNHDLQMERNSPRHRVLVDRVLGTKGHLSNDQAAAAVARIVEQSRRYEPRVLALLHLSRDCNTPELASAAARETLAKCGCHAKVFVAQPREALDPILLRPTAPRTNVAAAKAAAPARPAVAPAVPAAKPAPAPAPAAGGLTQLALFDFD